MASGSRPIRSGTQFLEYGLRFVEAGTKRLLGLRHGSSQLCDESLQRRFVAALPLFAASPHELGNADTFAFGLLRQESLELGRGQKGHSFGFHGVSDKRCMCMHMLMSSAMSVNGQSKTCRSGTRTPPRRSSPGRSEARLPAVPHASHGLEHLGAVGADRDQLPFATAESPPHGSPSRQRLRSESPVSESYSRESCPRTTGVGRSRGGTGFARREGRSRACRLVAGCCGALAVAAIHNGPPRLARPRRLRAPRLPISCRQCSRRRPTPDELSLRVRRCWRLEWSG